MSCIEKVRKALKIFVLLKKKNCVVMQRRSESYSVDQNGCARGTDQITQVKKNYYIKYALK